MILASASPRRRDLLRQLGLPVEIAPSDIPESPLPGESPTATARRLALAKAHAAARQLGHPSDTIVVAADTVVAFQGRIYGKPATPDEAKITLQQLRGKVHRVITAVVVLDPASGREEVGEACTSVRLRLLSDQEIAAYVASGDSLDKAGAYAIQNQAFHPVESIEGCYTNVVGLPLCILTEELEKFGVSVPDTWKARGGPCRCQVLSVGPV